MNQALQHLNAATNALRQTLTKCITLGNGQGTREAAAAIIAFRVAAERVPEAMEWLIRDASKWTTSVTAPGTPFAQKLEAVCEWLQSPECEEIRIAPANKGEFCPTYFSILKTGQLPVSSDEDAEGSIAPRYFGFLILEHLTKLKDHIDDLKQRQIGDNGKRLLDALSAEINEIWPYVCESTIDFDLPLLVQILINTDEKEVREFARMFCNSTTHGLPDAGASLGPRLLDLLGRLSDDLPRLIGPDLIDTNFEDPGLSKTRRMLSSKPEGVVPLDAAKIAPSNEDPPDEFARIGKPLITTLTKMGFALYQKQVNLTDRAYCKNCNTKLANGLIWARNSVTTPGEYEFYFQSHELRNKVEPWLNSYQQKNYAEADGTRRNSTEPTQR